MPAPPNPDISPRCGWEGYWVADGWFWLGGAVFGGETGWEGVCDCPVAALGGGFGGLGTGWRAHRRGVLRAQPRRLGARRVDLGHQTGIAAGCGVSRRIWAAPGHTRRSRDKRL